MRKTQAKPWRYFGLAAVLAAGVAMVALAPMQTRHSGSVSHGTPTKPAGGTTTKVARPSTETTATIPAARPTSKTEPAAAGILAVPGLTPQDASVDSLKGGLDALAANEAARARAIRDSLPETSLDRHILAWAIGLKGGLGVSSRDVGYAMQELAQWPAQAALRRNLERAVAREMPPAATVISGLGGADPVTAVGAIALARAYVQQGNHEAARKALSSLWRVTPLDAGDEGAILAEFGTLISVSDHRFRMERMLYADRTDSAGRVASVAGAEPLALAWTAVLRADAKAGKLLDAVPKGMRGAGYLFAKAKYLRRQGRLTSAAEIISTAPPDKDALVDPAAWWSERRLLSRQLLDKGKAKIAYEVVAGHAADSPGDAADAEFHAGWYALRWLKDAATASKHFARIADLTQGPISQARAYYWLGRAADAGAKRDAAEFYARAAHFGTTFYGQLAAAKLNRSNLAMTTPEPSAADRTSFQQREAVRAVARLQAAGANTLAATLYLDIADQLTSPGELAMLAAMAQDSGNHYLALKIGKIAAQHGLDIGALSHPMGVIPDGADISGSGKALAYAIARQESEFNVGAVSPAGARGLLQLMPGTAEQIAKTSGLAFAPEKLTTDAGYNATLGATFLGQQLDRFDGSYVLTFAGYNAGPRRADQWIARYGDPRGKSVEAVVDWIERIPFSETRAYVQRVMENYQVYKMRITGKYDIIGDLTNGRTTQ